MRAETSYREDSQYVLDYRNVHVECARSLNKSIVPLNNLFVRAEAQTTTLRDGKCLLTTAQTSLSLKKRRGNTIIFFQSEEGNLT